MLSYDNCPNNLPCMPNWPTVDGIPFPNSKPVYMMDSDFPVDYIRAAPEIESQTGTSLSDAIILANGLSEYSRRQIRIKTDPEFAASEMEKDRSNSISFALPVLSTIGLTDALKEVEKVLAFNQKSKHPNSKWKLRGIPWHDSKAVSHLSKAQNESLKDEETSCSHRGHAICRLLMSLQHEINQSDENTY